MVGVEYAAIQPGDLSPGAMNVDMNGAEDTNESAAAASTDPAEKRK